ncbi:5-methylcytosine-specific restriction protein A [Bradyrhizobium sp. LB12.1]|uniref:MrcB family domain-containing protein n=1 Tax=Bradyrhizobium sp. LB12.1 TaxID=3156327 RepID=UPI0033979078
MFELDEVFAKYISSSEEDTGDGLKSRRRLKPGNSVDVDNVITKRLPELVKQLIADAGEDAERYRIYGSVGQLNWTLAYIPWVAILRKDITNSTERGYYVVLLFSQDMKDCYLSLNQGVTQFRTAFGGKVGNRKIAQAARLALSALTVRPGFVLGRLNLAATNSLGKGYEHGAIISRRYRASDSVSLDQFRADLAEFLDFYDQIAEKLGPSLMDNLSFLSGDEYQEAANELATDEVARSPPAGGVPKPSKTIVRQHAKYKRDPEMAAMAIQKARYQCEIDAAHVTFTSRKTKKPFVEAHHLIPVQCQDEFEFSLDVPENIIALCPGCHRKFHHAAFREIRLPVTRIFSVREEGLKSRSIIWPLEKLTRLYQGEIEED